MENKSSVNFHGFGSGDAGVLADNKGSVDDLSNHVDFTDVAAQRSCWQHFEKEIARFAVERRAEHIVALSLPPLSKIHFHFTWFRINEEPEELIRYAVLIHNSVMTRTSTEQWESSCLVNDAFGKTSWLFQDVNDVTFIVFH
jgi:hypothetical protein